MKPLAQQLAEWTCGLQAEHVPSNVRETAVRAFVDTIGVLLAGATDDIAVVMRAWVAERPRDAGAIVPPYGLATDPETAALALGVLAHALDFDDIHPAMLGHPSGVLVPVILSLGALTRVDGHRAIAAYVAGAEVAAHLGRASAALQYGRGWHTTSTIGAVAAAVTAARLLDLDAAKTAHALGMATSAAAGLRANFGSHAKPLHAGQAASHGVSAALWARAGLQAAPDALDGPRGYLENFAGDRGVGAKAAAELGKRWELAEPGLQVKLYACCGGAHRSIDALTDMVREERLTPDTVTEVLALVDPIVPTLLVHPEPRTVAEARFSLQYCLAAILADGRLSLQHFAPPSLERADLREIGRRIRMEVHPELVSHKGGLAFGEVHVRMRDGASLSRRVDHPKGSGQCPLTLAELEQKFFDCARMYDPKHDWSATLRAIGDLRTDGSVVAMVAALTVTP
jgi:2-methylcitrate dehydratase PrpD